MKRILAILVPIALAACQTVPTDPVVTDPTDMKVVSADDKAPVKADEAVDAKPSEKATDDTLDETTDPKADDDVDAKDAVDLKDTADERPPETDTKAAPKDEAETKQTVTVPRNFVQYYKSDLVLALISDALAQDDVALMGIVSGARAYCQLRWEPGFITFMTAAKRQGLDLNLIADDHGYYHGAAVKALAEAKYECSEDDLIGLRAVEPY